MVRLRSAIVVPFAVAAYITAAYWLTASTSFANPAVTVARSMSDSFAGIRPIDVPGFIVAQLAGAVAATLLFRWLVPVTPRDAESVVVPHDETKNIWRHDAGGKFEVESAGVVSSFVRPQAIEAMKEIGVDITEHRSKSVDEFAGQDFDHVITVCDKSMFSLRQKTPTREHRRSCR